MSKRLKTVTQGDIPAEKTLDFIGNQNTINATMGQDLKNINENLVSHCGQNKEDFGKLNEKMDKFIESADKKFASKNVEFLVYTMLTILALATVYFVLRSVGLPIPIK